MNPFLRYHYDCIQTLHVMDAALIAARTKPNNDAELRMAADAGCRFLERLVADPDFSGDLWYFMEGADPYGTPNRYAYSRTDSQNAFDQMTMTGISQFDMFFNLERELLKQVGMKDHLVDFLIQTAKEAVYTPASLQEIEQGIQILQEQTCHAANILAHADQHMPYPPLDEISKERFLTERRKGVLNYLCLITTFLGGVTLLGVNAQATKLSSYGQNMSGQLGIALIAAAITMAQNAFNQFA